MLNRTDHEAHVNQKLVRKRTAAKIRSEEQRERLAASKIAASISSGPMNGARPPSGYPHRQDSASSYPSSTHRRRNTLKQVEAAAMMGPPPPGTPNPLRQSQQRYPSPAPGGRPQGYQLTDAPAPSSSARPSGSVRPQAIQVAQDKPATFAEMVCPSLRHPHLSRNPAHSPVVSCAGYCNAKSQEGRLRRHVKDARSFPSIPLSVDHDFVLRASSISCISPCATRVYPYPGRVAVDTCARSAAVRCSAPSFPICGGRTPSFMAS